MTMICGIIAEYDPFHNGHAWQLREARRLTQADHMICVISGSFTQRGMPALLAPHQRAQMALDAGADLVLQMPYSFSVCNAERFALGGVYILTQLGVEALCFGVEQDSIPIIENAAALLESPSDIFKKQLRQALDAGDSFPKAQGQALAQSLHADPALFSMPNAALGICYARANLRLNAGMRLFPVPRSGQYHDSTLPGDGTLPSATAVRAAILSGDWKQVQNSVPEKAFEIIEEAYRSRNYHEPGSLDFLLRWKLRQQKDFTHLPDLSEGIENRLVLASDCTNREAMVHAIKSKRYSYARINRLLSHVLTDTDERCIAALPPYAYTLGFLQKASPLLKNAKENGFSVYSNAVSGLCYDMDLDIKADDLWALGAGKTFGAIFRDKPIIL